MTKVRHKITKSCVLASGSEDAVDDILRLLGFWHLKIKRYCCEIVNNTEIIPLLNRVKCIRVDCDKMWICWFTCTKHIFAINLICLSGLSVWLCETQQRQLCIQIIFSQRVNTNNNNRINQWAQLQLSLISIFQPVNLQACLLTVAFTVV